MRSIKRDIKSNIEEKVYNDLWEEINYVFFIKILYNITRDLFLINRINRRIDQSFLKRL